jgi:hypothetical protein
MILAVVSDLRLRAVARRLLARRAVARRTERAGAASGLRSEPSARSSTRAYALLCESGCGIGGLCSSSRAIASGTRSGVARTAGVCVGPRAIRSSRVQASPGVNCRLEPSRSAIASQLGSPCRPIVFRPRRHRGHAGLAPVRGCAGAPRGITLSRPPPRVARDSLFEIQSASQRHHP